MKIKEQHSSYNFVLPTNIFLSNSIQLIIFFIRKESTCIKHSRKRYCPSTHTHTHSCMHAHTTWVRMHMYMQIYCSSGGKKTKKVIQLKFKNHKGYYTNWEVLLIRTLQKQCVETRNLQKDWPITKENTASTRGGRRY